MSLACDQGVITGNWTSVERHKLFTCMGGIGGHAGGHIPKEAALKIECFYFFDRHYAEIKIISINVNQNMSPFTYGIYK